MFSASDVANFLACHHLLTLDRAEATGQIEKPYFYGPGIEVRGFPLYCAPRSHRKSGIMLKVDTRRHAPEKDGMSILILEGFLQDAAKKSF